MAEVLACLKRLGRTDTMTRATRKALKRIAALGLRDRFGGKEPTEIAAVLDALVSRARRSPEQGE